MASIGPCAWCKPVGLTAGEARRRMTMEKIERLGRAAADGWIAAGTNAPAVEAGLALAGWLLGGRNLPTEEDLVDDEGRIPAELEAAFEHAFWGRIEEVAK